MPRRGRCHRGHALNNEGGELGVHLGLTAAANIRAPLRSVSPSPVLVSAGASSSVSTVNIAVPFFSSFHAGGIHDRSGTKYAPALERMADPEILVINITWATHVTRVLREVPVRPRAVSKFGSDSRWAADMGKSLWRIRRFVSDLAAVRAYADARTTIRYFGRVAMSVPAILRERTLVPADRKMRWHACRFRPLSGPSISLDGIHFSGAREMYCRRVYFAIDGFEVRPGDVVVDLGANAGLFTTMAAVYGSTVIAVEPQSGFHPVIEENLIRNGVRGRAELELALLGGNSGVLSLPGEIQRASHWNSEPEKLRMDELMRRHRLGEINLLKVDIEGSEFELFSGDVGWLAAVQRIVMEVHPAFGDPNDLRKVIAEAGFKTTVLSSEGEPVADASTLSNRGGYLFAARW